MIANKKFNYTTEPFGQSCPTWSYVSTRHEQNDKKSSKIMSTRAFSSDNLATIVDPNRLKNRLKTIVR